jgi:hypothetical protein
MSSPDLTPRDNDAPVTVASFTTPFDAELARAALESHGVHAVVGSDHGQYLTAWSFANQILNEGPPVATTASDAPDDMGSLRLRRRFVLARWFLYASSAALLFSRVPWLLPLFVVPLGLAIWSRTQPRYAFGVALGIQTAITVGSISILGLVGLPTVIPLIALQYAWLSTSPKYVEELQASPLPNSPSIEVGEAWKAGASQREPIEHPIWWVRSLAILIAAVIFLSFFVWSLRG